MKPTLLKFAASTMVIGASLVAVAPVANSSDVAEADSREAQAAARYAEQAREALNDSRPDRAVRFAERAVERMPRSAEYRHLLGRAYLAAGRFASAETSFQDALTINPDLDRTAFNLALSQIAQGDTADALAELRELEGRLNASDLGLAYALAGNRERAVEILRDAARANGGDPRARQNLALAYAMDGRWAEARITAAQDVSLAVLDQRMRDWAQFAQSANSWDQVSSLLGVQADGSDPGQPVRLALAPIQGEIMVADASVEDAPVQASAGAMVAFTAPVEESFEVSSAPRESSITEIEVPPAAEPDEAPIDMSASLASDPIEPARAAPAPVAPRVAGDYADVATGEFIVEDEVQFEETPVEVAAIDVAPPAAPVAPVAPPPAPRPEPVVASTPVAAPVSTPRRAPEPVEEPAPAPVAPAAERRDGRFYVQLGAFAVESNVDVAWERAVRRYSALSRFDPSRALYEDGRQLYRLSFGGFSSRSEANRMCRTLRRNRVDCFVRTQAGDSPFQMAARSGSGLAALR